MKNENNNKKIAIIGTVGVPSNYGGFETLVENIVEQLSASFQTTVYCSAKRFPEKIYTYKGAQLVYLPLDANGLQSIVYDILSILLSLKRNDIFLIFGVSGCIILPIIKIFTRKTFIVHIDGLEWKRNKWKFFAKAILRLSEKCGVTFSDAVIADNIAIKRYIQKQYHKKSEFIAYGGDHTNKITLEKSIVKAYQLPNTAYAFFVCRIEPENNCHLILEAFSTGNLPLVAIGNWDNSKYGRNLKKRYIKYDNLHLLDAIYDLTVLDSIRSNCIIYIHGHAAGGTNPSLVEAMSLGLAIAAYRVDYNIETTQGKALFFQNKHELINIIKNINSIDLDKIGNDLRNLSEEKYKWKIIAQKYEELAYVFY